MTITRYIARNIKNDLVLKMVLIGGPRQVGKTHLAKTFTQKEEQYLNWDDLADRDLLKKHQINPNLKTVVLDEIHKYVRWRMLLKGLFDKYKGKLKILVTGSAKLDHFRKGGDSLAGRFHYYRLHPLSLKEVDASFNRETTLKLLSFGGFPEPFLTQDETELRRWRRERLSRVVYQDVMDLGTVKELSKIELLVDLLPSKIASVLSYNSIAEDLEVSPNTIHKWVDALDLIYYCYRVLPYGPAKVRAVKKSHKLYLWDWSEIENVGARFENMVASHLLKLCHFLEDTQGHKMELRFLRNVDLKEIDFVVLKNNKPLFAVECKTGDKAISKHIYYYRDRLTIPVYYQVHLGQTSYCDGNIFVLPFEEFCKKENIP